MITEQCPFVACGGARRCFRKALHTLPRMIGYLANRFGSKRCQILFKRRFRGEKRRALNISSRGESSTPAQSDSCLAFSRSLTLLSLSLANQRDRKAQDETSDRG